MFGWNWTDRQARHVLCEAYRSLEQIYKTKEFETKTKNLVLVKTKRPWVAGNKLIGNTYRNMIMLFAFFDDFFIDLNLDDDFGF